MCDGGGGGGTPHCDGVEKMFAYTRRCRDRHARTHARVGKYYYFLNLLGRNAVVSLDVACVGVLYKMW